MQVVQRTLLILTGAVAMVILPSTRADAATITFTSFGDWQAAAGSPSWTVDFSAFGADTSFQTVPVDAGPFSIEQQGIDNFRNTVEVPPFQFSDNNGTNHASTYTDFGNTTVLVSFDAPISGWGANFYNIGSGSEGLGEGLTLDLGALGLLNVPTGTGFFGFFFTGGEQISSLTFQSRTNIPGSEGEGFGLDDVVGVNAVNSTPVPEPATMLLLGSGLAGLVARARRRGSRTP